MGARCGRVGAAGRGEGVGGVPARILGFGVVHAREGVVVAETTAAVTVVVVGISGG